MAVVINDDFGNAERFASFRLVNALFYRRHRGNTLYCKVCSELHRINIILSLERIVHNALKWGQNFVIILLFCLLQKFAENGTIIIVSVRSQIRVSRCALHLRNIRPKYILLSVFCSRLFMEVYDCVFFKEV